MSSIDDVASYIHIKYRMEQRTGHYTTSFTEEEMLSAMESNFFCSRLRARISKDACKINQKIAYGRLPGSEANDIITVACDGCPIAPEKIDLPKKIESKVCGLYRKYPHLCLSKENDGVFTRKPGQPARLNATWNRKRFCSGYCGSTYNNIVKYGKQSPVRDK